MATALTDRAIRYRGPGLVDLGRGLGTAPAIVLPRADRLDVMIGTDIWPMQGRGTDHLPTYGRPYSSGIAANLGSACVLPTEYGRDAPKQTAALWSAASGEPQELWAFERNTLSRYSVTYGTAADGGRWRFEPVGQAAFAAPDASKGLGTVQLLHVEGEPFPDLLVGDNDWRQDRPVPPEWSPTLSFAADMRIRYRDGEWQGRTVAGRVYLARNTGRDEPCYQRLEPLRSGTMPISVNGRSSPLLLRPFDAGSWHLLVADFRGDIYEMPVAQPPGELDADALVDGGIGDLSPLRHDGERLELPGCIASITAYDMTGNGFPDLLCTMEDGYLYVCANDGASFGSPVRLRAERSLVKAGVLAVPTAARNAAGGVDLYCGNASGEILQLRNRSRNATPDFEPPQALEAGGVPFRLLAGLGGSPHGPEELKWGYAGPAAAEWSQPGVLDLVLGCITGSYWLIPGVAAGVAWHRPIQMQMAGVPFVGEWRVRPAIADWNADGAPEMLTLDDQGYLALFGRDPDGGAEQLLPLGRVNRASGAPLYIGGPNRFPTFTFTGRCKLFPWDWDGDGILELLIGTHCKTLPASTELYERSNAYNVGAGVLLLDNVGTPARPVWGDVYAVTDSGGTPLEFGCHSCAPIVVDWSGAGRPSLVVGTEDGFLCQYDLGELGLSAETVPALDNAAGKPRPAR